MHVHGARSNTWRDEIVLKLLVNQNECKYKRCINWRLQKCKQQRQHASKIRANNWQELRDDADPQRHCYWCRGSDGLKRDPMEKCRYQGKQRTRIQVAACLIDGQVPRL